MCIEVNNKNQLMSKLKDNNRHFLNCHTYYNNSLNYIDSAVTLK